MIHENHFAIVKKGDSLSQLDHTIDTYRYVETTKKEFAEVRKDLVQFPSLRVILNLEIAPAGGNRILLYGQELDSTLLAASYITKYMAYKSIVELPPVDDEISEQKLESDFSDEEAEFDDLFLGTNHQKVGLQAHQIPFVLEEDFLYKLNKSFQLRING